MIASLPMYDLPEIRSATDAFWAGLALELGTDIALTRTTDWTASWRNPDLLFSQTCGYPFTHAFRGQLTYVATPHYEADGCDGPLYSSIVFAREKLALSELRGKVAAYNSSDSMSGMLALKLVFAPLAVNGQFFKSSIETGSHIASLGSVQTGAADVCAIDCVTVALLRKHRPMILAGLIAIAQSPRVPALPFVTRVHDASKMQRAMRAVFSQPSLEALRMQLLLKDFSILPADAYDTITRHEADLLRAGDLVL
jgi:ABC-type phosphate/phosphonate transport system substrate-binding protein